MKNRLLLMIAVCFASIAAFAQWTEPEIPTEYVTTLTLGNKYLVKNADSDQFIGAGTAYNVWGTATTMVDEFDAQGDLQAIVYVIDDTEDEFGTGISFVNSATELYTFVSGAATTDHYGWGEMHVDMASQGYNHFEIENNGDGTFCVYTPEYPEVIDGDTIVYSGYWGWVKDDEVYPQAVWAMLDKTVEGNSCKWQLIDVTVYVAKLSLYDALVESSQYSAMDQSVVAEATDIYNNSTDVEKLEEATKAVKEARNDAIVNGATSDSPTDATLLISNPTFDDGTDEWDCTFVSGTSATNVGWNNWNPQTNSSYTYVNHNGETVNPFVDNYIEAWEGEASYGASGVASIGNGELSQTIKEMPAGNWKLSADVIAVQQYSTVSEQYGVQLFAVSGDYERSIDISTGDGVPEHIELLFVSDGNDLTLGLRTQDTNCNWICADNFELLCYGNDQSAYKFILEETISSCEAQFPEVSELKAYEQVKSAYEDALAEAYSALNGSNDDDELQAAADALTAASAALSASVAEYAEVNAYIEYILSVEAMAYENGWEGLVDNLADYREGTLEPGYNDGELTSEEIAEMEDIVSNMISDYLSQDGVMNAGDDVSILIRNADFDTDFSGWTVDENGATPAWGGLAQNENTLEDGVKLADIGSGNAEVYCAVFDISQTIKNMPMGLYTLSCQALARDDGGDGIQGELYAVLNGEEQSQTIMSVYAEGSEEQLYYTGEWYDDYEATLDDGTTGWVPNGMSGANIFFYKGYYKNYFNILVTERGDLTIGVRDKVGTDWVLFDAFRLVYVGNDRENYVSMIEDLIEQANAVGDEGVLTKEADDMIMNAIMLGEDAITVGTSEDCAEAIQALQNAIAFGEETLALTADLQYLVDYTNEIRIAEVTSSDDELGELIDEIYNALDYAEIETNADVEEYILGLKSLYTVYVQCDHLDATESVPADITPVILMYEGVDNTGAGSTYGWEATDGASVGLGSGCVEMFNNATGAVFSQTIYNLAAGWYRLGVQGFYRPVGYTETVDAADVEEADTLHCADIFAGDKATRMASIYVDAATYSSDVAGSSSTSTYSVPYSMATANDAFENGLYDNCLQFEVAEDGSDVAIGIKKTAYIDQDWVIFDNWTLLYLGTTEPSEDPTTAIDGVEGEGAVAATAIYNVSGTQLSKLAKGINIVKTTMADGSVKVTKVLVK